MAKNENAALFKLGYGLYVVTTNDGEKDNGCILNSVMQVTSAPNRVAVAINKQNYTHDIVMKTNKLNINCIAESAPFSLFQNFGFRSGRDTDKLSDVAFERSNNGLAVLKDNINAYMSLWVESTVDLDTHTLFICFVTQMDEISEERTMTYTYYQDNVKPKPQPQKKKGYVCKICGYVHEGDELPADFICPLCKHPASDFEPI
ncbi:MAG: flavin reductase [Clostridia bacterium]|nr:flavin reductase [Clostridia bacterium]